jgi:hypothetical protein
MPSFAEGASGFAAASCTSGALGGKHHMPFSPAEQCTGLGAPCTYRMLQTTSVKGSKT